VANQNIRAFNVAKELWQPGDVPGDMSHSGDWGQYGFLQLGDYAGARERIAAFEWMAETTKNQRATGALSLVRARYIIETEEWKVQPIADNASNETILANGFSAVKTGDMATAEKMVAALGAKVKTPPAAAPANPHAEHGAAPAPAPTPAMGGGADSGKGVSVMHKELQALVAQAKGQTDQAIALLTEAAQIEESMRPPNGAADPIKPSHELLGEVLLQAGKAKEAAEAFEASLIRMPNRARSLMGAIRAHSAAGNKARAAERQATLNSFWKGKPFSGTTTEAR
jgi:tetratricopeptide (TPR) repeat protein